MALASLAYMQPSIDISANVCILFVKLSVMVNRFISYLLTYLFTYFLSFFLSCFLSSQKFE